MGSEFRRVDVEVRAEKEDGAERGSLCCNHDDSQVSAAQITQRQIKWELCIFYQNSYPAVAGPNLDYPGHVQKFCDRGTLKVVDCHI